MAVKVYATSKLTAVFKCPECGQSENKDVSKFIEHKTKIRLKYKCRCGHAYSVDLERRRSKRKDVQFSGYVRLLSEKHEVTIEDVSKHGIKIGSATKLPFDQGQKIEVEFTLDDKNHSKIMRQVIVKKIISDEKIGCEFLTTEHYDDLGKYLLFHY